MPIEPVHTPVRRAKNLDLDYKIFAGVRAITGHDLVAFLFFSSALRLLPTGRIPELEAAELAALRGCGRIAVVQGSALPVILLENQATFTATGAAPAPHASFRDQVAALRSALNGSRATRFYGRGCTLGSEVGRRRTIGRNAVRRALFRLSALQQIYPDCRGQADVGGAGDVNFGGQGVQRQASLMGCGAKSRPERILH